MKKRLFARVLTLWLMLGLWPFVVQASPSNAGTSAPLTPQPPLTLSEPAIADPTVLLPVLDPAFAPRFEVEGTVRALAIQPDNKVIIAGFFDTVNGPARQSIARLNPDGSVDPTFTLPVSMVYDPDFYALALLADGKLLVGGNFNFFGVDGRLRYGLVRLYPDGSLDEAFYAGSYSSGGLDGAVYTILVQPDGRILIGGAFSQILGSPRQRIARLNADGSVDATFDPGGGANDKVLTLDRQTDGKIVIGGAFTAVDDVPAARIARLNADGTLDAAFAVSADDIVNAVAVQSDGHILFGGAFTTVNGQDRPNLARVQPDGDLDSLWTNMFHEIQSVLPLPDNSVIVGGWYPDFYYQNWPVGHNARLARFDSAGTLVNVVSFEGEPTEVLTLAQRPDGQVVAGGMFRNLIKLEGLPVTYRHSLSLFSPDPLHIAAGFQPIVARVGEVHAILPTPDDNWMVLGSFSLVDGSPHIGIARIGPTGTLDTTFAPPFRRPDNTLHSGVRLTDGSLLLGGDFTDNYTDQKLIGQTLVRLDTNGNLLPFPQYAYSSPRLALDTEDRILVAGSASTSFPGIVRLLPDGNPDTTFAPGAALSGSVEPDGTPGRINTILIQADGRIVVAGKFSDYNNEGRSSIVRLETNGAVDASFAPPVFETTNPTTSPPEVYTLAQQGTQLLVGGYFSVTDGAASYFKLARLQPNGSLDSTFTAFFGNTGGGVRTMALLSDNSILAGGHLQEIVGDKIYNNMFHLLSGGARNPAFTSSVQGSRQSILDGAVQAIAVKAEERVLIGGSFVSIEGTARSSLGGYQLQSLVSAYIDPVNGGEMHAPADGVSYIFPSGTFTETVILVHNPRSPNTLPATGELASNGLAFDVTAIYSSTGQLAQLVPGTHFTLTIEPLTKGPLIPGTLALWRWDETSSAWSQAEISSTVSANGEQLVAQVGHLSLFTVLGETRRVYLPLVLK